MVLSECLETVSLTLRLAGTLKPAKVQSPDRESKNYINPTAMERLGFRVLGVGHRASSVKGVVRCRAWGLRTS